MVEHAQTRQRLERLAKENEILEREKNAIVNAHVSIYLLLLGNN